MTPIPTNCAIPILIALDIAATGRFYEALGFGLTRFPENGYLIARRGTIEIHFVAFDDRHVAENTSCYIRLEDADVLFREWKSTGIARMNEIEDKPWGMREFAVWDPAGNLLRVGHRIQ